MSFNSIKFKEDLKCTCGAQMLLPKTKESDPATQRYFAQSKFICVGGTECKADQSWYELEQIDYGEVHAWCPVCTHLIEFTIQNGQITESKIKR